MDIWAAVAARRVAIAGWARGLAEAEADAASWCAGWRVRDVLGHLVHLAEATQWTMARDMAIHGVVPDRALGRVARGLGERPAGELADRLERAASGRFHLLGTPVVVSLGELLVHGADMMRPLGADDGIDPALAVAVLPVYRRLGRFAFHGAPASGVRLVATDAGWSAGRGPEVRGRAVDLVLLLANRRQVLTVLDGPGVPAARP